MNKRNICRIFCSMPLATVEQSRLNHTETVISGNLLSFPQDYAASQWNIKDCQCNQTGRSQLHVHC